MMESIYQLENVTKTFEVRTGFIKKRVGEVRAVDDITFDIRRSETFGVIGETGSGKTTLAKMMLLVYKPDSGRIIYKGGDISGFGPKDKKSYRRNVQTVFQDPTSSLNPRHNVKATLEAPLAIFHEKSEERVHEVLRLVNLSDDYLYRYPHTLSGGEKQRVAIARALALNPEVMILDEPTSALDVSVQAKIIALLKNLKASMNITYVFISHDLSLVANFCDRLLVILNGRACEMGKTEEIFTNPLHPYTRLLLASVPIVSESEEQIRPKDVPGGLVETLVDLKSVGCVFRGRCWLKQEICKTKTPELEDKGNGHWVACHFA
jgi:oligopeptide transport system ATP-binding protein